MMKRFDERNEEALAEEAAGDQLDRAALFNYQELLMKAIAGAAFRACDRLKVEPGTAHGELVPNPETKRWEVTLVFDDATGKPGETTDEEIQRVMREEFTTAQLSLDGTKRLLAAIDERFADPKPIEDADAYFERWRPSPTQTGLAFTVTASTT